jgi:hypothetical protein
MTHDERRTMEDAIEAAVLRAIAPLAHRVTVLETRQESAGKLVWIVLTAVIVSIVSAIASLIGAGK